MPATPSATSSPASIGSTCTRMIYSGTCRRWVGPIASIDIPLPNLCRKIGQPRRIQPNAIRTVTTYSGLTYQLHSHVSVRYDIQIFYGDVLRYGVQGIHQAIDT